MLEDGTAGCVSGSRKISLYILLHGYCDENRPKSITNKNWLDNIKKDCSDLGITQVRSYS